jgi:Tol biopolymer transport system component
MKIRTIAKKTLPILLTLALTAGCSTVKFSNVKTKILGTRYEAPIYDTMFLAKGSSSKSDNSLEVFAAKYKDKNMYEKQSILKTPINELTYGWEIILKDENSFKRLTNNSVQEFYPKISPDGTYVVFERRDKANKNSEVYKIDLETMIETKLIDKSSCERPVISPDGEKIAYNYQGDIWVMDKDGKNKKELLNLNVDIRISEWNKKGLVFHYSNSMHPNAIIDFEEKEVKDYNPGN